MGKARVASQWGTRRLGELTDNFDAIRVPVKESERRTGPYPYYGASGIVDCVDDYLFDGEYLLIAEDGENLRTRKTPVAFLANGKFWVNNHAHIVRANAEADTRFLMYALRIADISGYVTGSAIPKLTQASMNRIPIPAPPLDEQRAIAHILGTLDDKIELNQRMNETLEAMARAIFKSWFIDFDPVRRNMARAAGQNQPSPQAPLPLGEGQGENVAEGIAFDHLFPDSFVDSPIGKIPKGWRVAPLPEVCEINPPRRLTAGQNAAYLDMQNMPTRGHRPPTWILRSFTSGSRFANGDTLLARITPCLENGKTAYVDFLRDGEVGWGSTEFIVLSPRPPLPAEYAYCLGRDEGFRDFAIQNMTGSSGRQRVPTSCLGQYILPAPPDSIARRFGEIVRPLFAGIKVISEESGSLAAIRDALLPKLLSGEIRVNDAENAGVEVR